MKDEAEVAVPAGFVTLIAPLVAPVGTWAEMVPSSRTLKAVVSVPWKENLCVPVKPLPLSVNGVLGPAAAGENEDTTGATGE